jgi:hypothetical protein
MKAERPLCDNCEEPSMFLTELRRSGGKGAAWSKACEASAARIEKALAKRKARR